MIDAMTLLKVLEDLDETFANFQVELISQRTAKSGRYTREQTVRIVCRHLWQSELAKINAVCDERKLTYVVQPLQVEDGQGYWRMPMIQITFKSR